MAEILERTLSETRQQFTKLPDELKQKNILAVTKRGKPILAVIPWDYWESMLETMDILEDEEAMKAIRQFEKEKASGKLTGTPWSQLKKEMNR